MRSRIRISVVVAATVLSLGMLVAPAESQSLPGFGVELRAGYFWPANGRASAAKSQWLTIGTEFKILQGSILFHNPINPGYFSLSADLMEGGGFRSVPVLVNYVVRVADRFSASAGAGVSFVSRPGFEDSVSFAYQASLRYDWSVSGFPVIVRLAWNSVTSVDQELDGMSLTAGVRF